MKKCEFENCNAMIDDKYHFCYKHKNEKYIDVCHLHGKTEFKSGKCCKCHNLKRPIYRISKRNGLYMIGNHPCVDHPLYGYFKWLIHRTRKYAMRFVSKIYDGPGTYGIFIKNARSKLFLGRCMYVGQSVHIKRRVGEHQEKILLAENCIKKGIKPENHPKDLQVMYFDLAKIGYDNLKFAKLMGIDKTLYSKMNKVEAFESLAILEQYSMDCFQPELNVIAARRSDL